MYKKNDQFEKFENKVWLSSPTMYPDSMRYVMEAYETNWMSTVGANINEVEKIAAENIGNEICGRIVLWYGSTSSLYETCRRKIIRKTACWNWCITEQASILYRYDI